MERRLLLLAAFVALPTFLHAAAAAPTPQKPRAVQQFTTGWRFLQADAPGAEKPDFDDSAWTAVTLPHDWSIAGPFKEDAPSKGAGAFAPTGIGWYRKTFTVPASWKGRIIKVNFEGVQNAAEIWLNGKPVAVTEASWGRVNYHESGWTAWQADLTDQVKFGEENLLALRVSKNNKSTDLDTGDYFILGGIYRPVTLFAVPPNHIADLTVRTHLLSGGRAEVKTLISVAGGAPEKIKATVNLEGKKGYSLIRLFSSARAWRSV